ncbi:MAG: alpha/beta fold hydrolase [Gammaproteobacteria bacterium]|nr:alpha/beta fold hydrolase [Gammaproteobacteria bacterium]MDE2348927.1 alpha/beta fold hydrolase [Gammaproteobacteria bacterium]
MSSAPHRPPVLFVPGTWLDGRLFAAQTEALSGRFAPLIADITRSDSIEALAADVLAGAPERFALVGLSMGGIVALEIYRCAPERVTHLALLDTTPKAESADRASSRLSALAAVARGESETLLRETLAPRYLAPTNRSDGRLTGAVVQMGLDLGPETFKRQSRALERRADREPMLPSITCPTLVLCGREDLLCPQSLHAAMAAQIPRADLVVLGECGHLAPLERPGGVTNAIRDLMERS